MTPMAAKQTPSQTIGPFFSYGLAPTQYGYPGESAYGPEQPIDHHATAIVVRGIVLDGANEPISDALVEIWQADARGHYAGAKDAPVGGSNQPFSGFSRMGTGTTDDHRFEFRTLKPGAIGPDHAPHLNVCIFMRGLINHMFTRIYFDDEPANATDPVLQLVPEGRRSTLIATTVDPANHVYDFTIRMQGSMETVFFDL
ncbi:MAG: protocatechuate 3,4-dioxygenase subunit alpha [Pseudomonadota bacterium]